MSGEHKEIVENGVIDSYLADGDIGSLYLYMLDGQRQDAVLSNMLDIWSFEKEAESRTVLEDVSSYQEAAAKYAVISKIMEFIINESEMSPMLIQYAKKEISVWAMLVWICAKLIGMKRILALEAASRFMEKYQYPSASVTVMEGFRLESVQELLSLSLANEDGYLAKKLTARLPGRVMAEPLLEEAEDKICRAEREIKGRLYTPTNLEKTREGLYILVDCWHDRVLHSRELCDIKDWNVLDRNLRHPHSVCEGNGVFAVENTDKDSVCFYRMEGGSFQKTDEINAGKKPHRLLYDENRELFWTLASYSQEIFGIRVEDGKAKVQVRQKIEKLQDSYVRSMRMIDGKLYIVSGPGYILELAFAGGKFVVAQKYPVPEEYFSMNDLAFFQGYFWISVYFDSRKRKRPALLRLSSLDDFSAGNCENLYDDLGMKGIPYFFSWMDGKLCIPEIDTYSRIVLYDAEGGELKVNRVLYDFGEAVPEDIAYRHRNDIEVREYEGGLA